MNIRLRGHNFHIVPFSYYPLFVSIAVLNLVLMLCEMFHNNYCSVFGLVVRSYCVYVLVRLILCWLDDISLESMQVSNHTDKVRIGLRLGMVLFIVTEIMFFFSFFWSYFHSALSPSIMIGSLWPTVGLKGFIYYGIPLYNTILLVSSGSFLTLSHHLLLVKNYEESLINIYISIGLGIVFVFCQLIEYYNLDFSINDSIYGSVFFMVTGFHGFHVFLGLIMLSKVSILMEQNFFNFKQHVGYECAAWYWHFVDVVWLFLYVWFYVWGSNFIYNLPVY